MRIFPLALIAVGVFGVLKHYGLVDPAFVAMFWPLLLIGIGVVMLVFGPRWRAGMRGPRQGRWERRMHRHFGPGWANLSDEERERFRAGMRQWHTQGGPWHRPLWVRVAPVRRLPHPLRRVSNADLCRAA